MIRKFFAAFGEDGLINIAAAMKGLGHEMLTMFDQLSTKTQQDIVKAFPTIASVATSKHNKSLLLGRNLMEGDDVHKHQGFF